MTFKEYMLHQLREMKRELITALDAVPEDELGSFEPGGHWPIAWIAEHCTEVADNFLHKAVHGNYLISYAEHVENWPDREPQPGDKYPPLDELQNRWSNVCDDVTAYVEDSSEEGLQRTYARESYVDSILRVINHTNSHLRSLWCILGEKRLDHKWAEQQNFLA